MVTANTKQKRLRLLASVPLGFAFSGLTTLCGIASASAMDFPCGFPFGPCATSTPSIQNQVADSNASTAVNSQINAGSANTVNVDQSGNGLQNADVGASADTNVNSAINAGSTNNVSEMSNGSGIQNSTVGSDADTTVNSAINAGSENNVNVDQNGTSGFSMSSMFPCGFPFGGCGSSSLSIPGLQNTDVNADADTNVNSQINAGSSNATDVMQNGSNGQWPFSGFNVQNGNVWSAADTTVNSAINAGSENNVNVDQSGVAGMGGVQNAVVNANANTIVNNLINAGALNNVDLHQLGAAVNGGWQNANVLSSAQTLVNSLINAGAINNVNISQMGQSDFWHWFSTWCWPTFSPWLMTQPTHVSMPSLDLPAIHITVPQVHVQMPRMPHIVMPVMPQFHPFSFQVPVFRTTCGCTVMTYRPEYQNASTNSNATTTVNSMINAGSSNNTGVLQMGSGLQNSYVNSSANTDVNSQINAGSANNVNVQQY